MRSVDVIHAALTISHDCTMKLASDLADKPFASPTPLGEHGCGNHPMWVMGHAAYAEGGLLQMITGEPNPVEHWKANFSGGSQPKADPGVVPGDGGYPKYEEVVATFARLRQQTFAELAKLTDADLVRKPAALPPELADEPLFATVGRVFLFIAMHQMSHFGQLADARKALGRKPLMG